MRVQNAVRRTSRTISACQSELNGVVLSTCRLSDERISLDPGESFFINYLVFNETDQQRFVSVEFYWHDTVWEDSQFLLFPNEILETQVLAEAPPEPRGEPDTITGRVVLSTPA